MNQIATVTNVKGLILNFLIAAAVAGARAVFLNQNDHVAFNFATFLADSGLTFAFSNLVGFYTRHQVVAGGQGLPGVNPQDLAKKATNDGS